MLITKNALKSPKSYSLSRASGVWNPTYRAKPYNSFREVLKVPLGSTKRIHVVREIIKDFTPSKKFGVIFSQTCHVMTCLHNQKTVI